MAGRLGIFARHFLAPSFDRENVQSRIQLLRASGFPYDVSVYFIAKRSIAAMCLVVGGGAYAMHDSGMTIGISPIYGMLAAAVGLIFVMFDKSLLEAARIRRTQRIVNEIYMLSNQLLYYTGSRMNLHSKLIRCIPYTRVIRSEMQLLVNEWYQDADEALRQFKARLGTEEAFSFAETLNTLRLHESSSYYELLRQRIQDYKEKLDMAKESRKETTSYLLFVLAGIPILNTFRVFIYPWVSEGQKLFMILN